MRTIYLAALFSLASLTLWGQGTAQIQGVVKDSTGAAIGAADVKATQTDTGAVRTVPSGADGNYVFPSLPVGPYRLEVTKTGFATYVQSGIVLQVNNNATVDVTMKIGEVSTQVQVEANAALVDTQGTSVGAVIEQKRIVELPLNGRNPVELIQLAGAAVPGGKNNTAGYPGGLNISVAGGLLSGVTYYLDGTLYNNPFDATNLPFPFPDALQEFKVETNSLTAQNGLHSGAAVSAVIKSGTNAVHGDLFEFFRNGHLNARNSLAARRDTLKRNQFGGTIGAPIIKNKLFVFGGFQGTRLRSDPTNQTAFVPTAQMLAGDLTGSTTFPATVIDPLNGQAFPGKQIPISRLNPQSLKLASLLPTSNISTGQVSFGPIQQQKENQMLGRVDYQISDKQFLFGRYMASKYTQATSYALSKNLLDSTSGALDDLAQTYGIGHTYLISPTTVNTFRAGYNRLNILRHNDDYFSPCDLGVKNYTCFVPHQTIVAVTGGFTVGSGTYIDASFVPSTVTLSDDVSVIRGSHQFGFGVSLFKYQHSQKANVYSSGTFNFGGLVAGQGSGTGSPMADFLLGQVGTMTQGLPNTVFTTKRYGGLYAMDTWKASRRLTVNMGLRWEPALQQRLNNGAVYNYDVNRMLAGVRSTVFPLGPPGMLFAGDPNFNGKTGVNNRYKQFAPRVGLSFDPQGDGKTVIRAAGGISYDFPNTQIMSTPATAPPFGNALQVIPGPFNFSDPWANYPGGNQFVSAVPGSFVNGGSFMAMQPNAKTTTTYSWNAAIQHQFGNSWLLSATYMGTQTAHLWLTVQRNPAVIVPGPLQASCVATATDCNAANNSNARRVAALAQPNNGGKLMGFVDEVESGGTIHYNGLILAMAKRLTKGVSLNANYTWSHCIGDITQASTILATGSGLNIPSNRKYDRGNCQTPTLDGTQALDRRHIANITAVLESPKFANNRVNMVASGWRLSTSYRKLSGAWQTVTTGTDLALNGQGGTQRPNQVLADPLCAVQQAGPGANSCFLNKAAFAQPALGTFGNLGRSNVPGPGFFSIDTALSRTFRIREGKTLEARGEAFNLTNSFRAGPVTTALNNVNFGKVLTAQDPRIMQLALKFVF